MGMATSGCYGGDPEWAGGPKYNIIFLLPKQDLDYPIRENGTTSYASWHFEKSEQFEWLEKNCFEKYIWSYDNYVMLEDDRMVVHISFVRKEHADAFSSQFEICTWNFESRYSRPTNKPRHSFVYDLTDQNQDPDKHDEEYNEVMQWCRENTNCEWNSRVTTSGDQESIAFYFMDEKDAAAFKLRWM